MSRPGPHIWSPESARARRARPNFVGRLSQPGTCYGFGSLKSVRGLGSETPESASSCLTMALQAVGRGHGRRGPSQHRLFLGSPESARRGGPASSVSRNIKVRYHDQIREGHRRRIGVSADPELYIDDQLSRLPPHWQPVPPSSSAWRSLYKRCKAINIPQPFV